MKNVNELLITASDGPAMVFAVTLTANEASVIKPGTSGEGEPVVGEAWKKATDAFATIRDLLEEIVGSSAAVSSDQS